MLPEIKGFGSRSSGSPIQAGEPHDKFNIALVEDSPRTLRSLSPMTNKGGIHSRQNSGSNLVGTSEQHYSRFDSRSLSVQLGELLQNENNSGLLRLLESISYADTVTTQHNLLSLREPSKETTAGVADTGAATPETLTQVRIALIELKASLAQIITYCDAEISHYHRDIRGGTKSSHYDDYIVALQIQDLVKDLDTKVASAMQSTVLRWDTPSNIKLLDAVTIIKMILRLPRSGSNENQLLSCPIFFSVVSISDAEQLKSGKNISRQFIKTMVNLLSCFGKSIKKRSDDTWLTQSSNHQVVTIVPLREETLEPVNCVFTVPIDELMTGLLKYVFQLSTVLIYATLRNGVSTGVVPFPLSSDGLGSLNGICNSLKELIITWLDNGEDDFSKFLVYLFHAADEGRELCSVFGGKSHFRVNSTVVSLLLDGYRALTAVTLRECNQSGLAEAKCDFLFRRAEGFIEWVKPLVEVSPALINVKIPPQSPLLRSLHDDDRKKMSGTSHSDRSVSPHDGLSAALSFRKQRRQRSKLPIINSPNQNLIHEQSSSAVATKNKLRSLSIMPLSSAEHSSSTSCDSPDLGSSFTLLTTNDPISSSWGLLDGIDLCQDVPVSSPDFDVLKVKDSSVLRLIIFYLFSDFCNFADIRVSKSNVNEYIREVSRMYRPNPFHNFHHSASVSHYLVVLLRDSKCNQFFSPVNNFALLLSALVHDVDHPGNTNLFEINSNSQLALLYNDQSVLENHHCSTAFLLMRKPGANVLSKMDLEVQKEVRKLMVAAILATDMSKHSQVVGDMNDRLDSIKYPNYCKAATADDQSSKRAPVELNEQIVLAKIILHAADLSAPVRNFHVARKWATMVTAEFNSQVERETELGLPVLSFMAACDERTFLKNEINFSGFFVAPMYRMVVKLFPSLEPILYRLEMNIVEYKRLMEEIDNKILTDASLPH